MKDYRHPDQKIMTQAVQTWWSDFLLSKPSDEKLFDLVVKSRVYHIVAADELIRRNCLNVQYLSAIVQYVPECSSKALGLLSYIHRAQKLKIKPLVWLGELGLTA